MKTKIVGFAIAALLFAMYAWAQTSTPAGFINLGPLEPVANCPAPAAGANIICSTSTGYMVSDNGGAYYSPKPSAAGVVTFNGRAGAVVPTAGDYSYAELSAPPTTITCTTASLSAGSGGTLTASGCTIK